MYARTIATTLLLLTAAAAGAQSPPEPKPAFAGQTDAPPPAREIGAELTRQMARTAAPGMILFALTIRTLGFPFGAHVCEVEVDPDTGHVAIERMTMVDDFGRVINPLLLAGQVHGGVAQGIGQALMEQVSYDTNGQPITGSFMDYELPRAEDIPSMEIGDHPSPAKSNPLGTKGCGEAGCAGSLVCIVNAVVDALSDYGITHIDMPLTPERVWRAIQDAKAKQAA